MKIAYCIHSLVRPAGMERVLCLKANYLVREAGHEVYVITAHQNGRKLSFPLDPGVRLVDLGKSERFLLGPYRRALNAALCRIRPDLTISLGGRDMLCLKSCTDGSLKLSEFHFPHEKYIVKHGNNLYSRCRTRRMEKAAAELDAFVVLTEADKKDWQKSVPKVENICNPLTFNSKESSALDAKRVLGIGRLDKSKNFSDLIKAWELVAEKHPDWTLDIFGSGVLRDALLRQISRSGLEGKVQLRGNTTAIREELLACSMLAMSSILEGFPMAFLEALDMGVPIVCYDCPKGPAEIVQDGCNGFIVRMGDVESLAERICRIIEDQELRARLGEGAKASSARYTIDGVMKKWEQLWMRLLHT